MTNDVKYQAMCERLQTPSQREAIRKAVEDIGGDGHSIMRAEFFSDRGIDDEFVQRMSHTYSSDGSYKGSIWNDRGEMLAQSTGVYTLDFLRACHRIFKTPGSSKMGRGFAARELTEQLLAVL